MQSAIRFFSVILFCLCAGPVLAQDIFPLSEVKPGQTGVARTVFAGDQIEEFGVKVIDVLRNFSPKRNLIIVELSGQKVEFTGPARGMSGSPVYIDGKLAGALAYGLDAFLKTPVMGVTPIEEMLEIFERENQRGSELANQAVDEQGTFTEMALGLREPSWENFLAPARISAAVGHPIQPFGLPLVFSGFSQNVVAEISPALARCGFVAMIGGRSDDLPSNPDDLRPGAAVGGVLISGDADIAAVGTVTYRRGNQILAFGHPFFGNGPITLPMSSARVLLTLPSLAFSSKLTIGTGIVGALKQDRTTGIYGVLGEVAPMVPVKIRYENENGGATEFNFSYADEKSLATLMPLFLRITIIEALESARLAGGENSLRLQGTIRLQKSGGSSNSREIVEIPLNNFYSGSEILGGISFLNSILQSTGEVAATLGALAANKFHPVSIQGIELRFSSFPGRRVASLEQVWLDRTTAAPGDSVTVHARLRRHQGDTQHLEQRLMIPRHMSSGTLNIVVGSSDELTRLEARTTPTRFQPQSLNHLIELLQSRRRNDVLNLQLRQSDRGVIVDGEEMPGLPPSIYAVVQPPNARGKVMTIREQVLAEIARPMSIGVSGLATVKLAVQQK